MYGLHPGYFCFHAKIKTEMNNTIDIIKEDFISAKKVLDDFCSDPQIWNQISKTGIILTETLRQGNKIITCGNGGSHCDAMHFAEELSGRYRNNRRALAALAISDPSHITCVSNDFGYEYVFARYIEAIGVKGDALVMFTSSGRSVNLLRAAEQAKKQDLILVGITGKDGGKLASMCDYEIRVSHFGYADRIQEIHIKLIHSLIHYIEIELGF